MATITRTVITYRCPRCKADIGRQFGLLTSLTITCFHCQTKVRIDRNVIAANWGFNFAWVGGLLTWLALAVGVLVDPKFAATVANHTLPAVTMENRLVIAGFSAIPSLLAGLVIGGLGMLLGSLVSLSETEESTTQNEDPSWLPPPTAGPSPAAGLSRAPVRSFPLRGRRLGQRDLGSLADDYASQLAPPDAPPKPKTRSVFVRAFFVLLWPVVFFFAGVFAVGLVMGTGEEIAAPPEVVPTATVGLMASPQGQGPLVTASTLLSEQANAEMEKKHAEKKPGEKAAPWLLLGMLIVFVLGCVGLLPSTGRKFRGLAAPPVVTPPPQPSEKGTQEFTIRNYASAVAPEPKRRSIFVRVFFTLLWPTVFFFAAVMVMSALTGGFSAELDPVQKQLQQHSAQKHTGWICLVSISLFCLGCAGVLPGTRAWKRRSAAE